MSKKKKNSIFIDSLLSNNETLNHYITQLTEIALSVFEWKNLPPTIDERFLELTLSRDGQSVFFHDEAIGYLALQNLASSTFNVYGIPIQRTAYSGFNSYTKKLTEKDSVLIFNNLTHTNSLRDIIFYARKLYELDRTIDVNIKAQKTPVVILCDENQRLTMLNLYKAYDGNEPFIFGDKKLNPNDVKALSTGAPFVADKLYDLKTKLWLEVLTRLGVSNVSNEKKERMTVDEVSAGLGDTMAYRFGKLSARQQACKKINEMFGTDISCELRTDVLYTITDKGDLLT